MTDTISALFTYRLSGLLAAAIFWMHCGPVTGQITYDGNGILIGAETGIDPVVQDAFTVPAGTDRLLLVCITRDGPGNPTTFSVTFNGQSLDMEAENVGGSAGLVSDIHHIIFQENTSLFGDGDVMYCSGSRVEGDHLALHQNSGVGPDSLNDGIFLADASSRDINHLSSDSLFSSIASRTQAACTCLMPP